MSDTPDECPQPCRNTAVMEAKERLRRIETQRAGWQWLVEAMEKMPPTDQQEAALHDMLWRMHHERST